MKKHNGLYWHKILIIDNINKAIMSLFVEVLLPWSLLAKGRGSQQPWSLIPRPSPEKLLGHPASPPLSALVLLHLEISVPAFLLCLDISIPAYLLHLCCSGGSGLSPKAHTSSVGSLRILRCFHFQATSSTGNSKHSTGLRN